MYYIKASLLSLVTLTAAIGSVNAALPTVNQVAFARVYTPPVGPGDCAVPNNANSLVAALNAAQFDDSVCGKIIHVNAAGRTVDVNIADRCTACPTGDIELTAAAFRALGMDNPPAGLVPVTWQAAI